MTSMAHRLAIELNEHLTDVAGDSDRETRQFVVGEAEEEYELQRIDRVLGTLTTIDEAMFLVRMTNGRTYRICVTGVTA